MIPVFRRFSMTDTRGAPEWINNIYNPLNVFCEQVVNLFNGNIAIGENVQGMKYTTVFTTPSTLNVFTPFSFNYTGKGTPTCVLLGKLERTDGFPITYTSSAVTSWTLNTNKNPKRIDINFINGLSSLKEYRATLLIL